MTITNRNQVLAVVKVCYKEEIICRHTELLARSKVQLNVVLDAHIRADRSADSRTRSMSATEPLMGLSLIFSITPGRMAFAALHSTIPERRASHRSCEGIFSPVSCSSHLSIAQSKVMRKETDLRRLTASCGSNLASACKINQPCTQ